MNQAFRTNLFGPWRLTQKYIPIMKRNKYGVYSLFQYKNLLLNKLKDTLEVTGFDMVNLKLCPSHAIAASKNKLGGKVNYN